MLTYVDTGGHLCDGVKVSNASYHSGIGLCDESLAAYTHGGFGLVGSNSGSHATM